MTTTVTVGFDDWAALDVGPVSYGSVTFQPGAPSLDADSGRITTQGSVVLALDDTGTASRDFDPTPTGEGVWIDINVSGYSSTAVLVSIPDQDAVSLVELLQSHQLDPDTLQPLPSFPTVGAALADMQAQIDSLAPSGVSTGVDPDGTPTITVTDGASGASITTDSDGTPVLTIGG